MLDSTRFMFRKLAPNVYVYTPFFAFVKKAYQVTYKEKKELAAIYMHYSCFVPFICFMGIIPVKYSIPLTIVLYVVCFSSLYFCYRRQVKKIIGDRKKLPCPRWRYIDFLRKYSELHTWKEHFEAYFYITVGWLPVNFALVYYFKKSQYLCVIFFGLLTMAQLFAIWAYGYSMYLKYKNKNGSVSTTK